MSGLKTLSKAGEVEDLCSLGLPPTPTTTGNTFVKQNITYTVGQGVAQRQLTCA